jgi:hypothetical protein
MRVVRFVKRRHLFLGLGAVALVVACDFAWVVSVCNSSRHVQNNTVVGRTESQLRATYGSPTSDDVGYISLGLAKPRELPPGSIRTLRFAPGGLLHPEGGTLVVWLVDENGEWRCFESCWYADGVVF